MIDPGSDESLSADEQALLDWLELPQGSRGPLPDDLRSRISRLPQLLGCLDLLQQLARPVIEPNEESPHAQAGAISGTHFPREFGPYTLERELGRGGMGVVYLARHRRLETSVAIKVIRATEFASDEEVRRFYREARAAARLQHPHVIRVHDAGEIDGLPFLAMQYISGQTLAQWRQSRSFTPSEAARLIVPIARAVHYLHGEGVIHRDLKPGNILIDERGHPYVTDFGLAKLFELDSSRTATGTVIGTPAYMAPEQAWGRPDDVTAASDVYSLGAILYELLTGRTLFPGTNPLDQILRLRDSEPLPPRFINSHVPLQLQQICLHCLEKRSENRYVAAAELADDLERFLQGEPITFRHFGWWNGFRRWIRREAPLASHLAGFACVAIAVQAADLLARQHREPYLPVMTVLAIWTVLAVVLQKLLRHDVPGVKLIWVAVDAILFTVAVAFAEGPIESLLAGYALLIVVSGLWYQESLVILTTIVSLVSGAALLWTRGSPQPVHYPFLAGSILIVIGGVVTALVRRIRLLVDSRIMDA